MTYSELFLVALVALPLLGGLVTLVAPRANTLAQILFVLAGVSGLGAVASVFLTGAPEIVLVPGFLALSALPAFFLGLVSLGVILTSIFAIGYLPRYAQAYPASRVNAAMALFVVGMIGVLLAQVLPAFLIAWEVMSLSAYFLVIADRRPESLSAGLIYFVMTQIGFVSLLSGFLLLAGGNAFASWADIAAITPLLPASMSAIAFFLALAGFGSKAGLVPLHAWLPHAHPQAPSHASALLSGVMLNVAIYGFLRVVSLFAVIPLSWAVVVIVLGLLSGFFGAVQAATERDAKRLLAYSSIENMGLIFSGLGVMLAARVLPPELAAPLVPGIAMFVLLHIINHFLFKTGLFLTVGAIMSATHTRNLDELGGLAQRWPIFAGSALALALAAGSLPPLGTFYGEWAYVQTLALSLSTLPVPLAAGAAIILSSVALVAGLALFASVKLFALSFLGRARTAHTEHAQTLPLSMTLPPALAAILLVLSGILAIPAVSLGRVSWNADLALAYGAAVNPWWIAVVAVVLPVFLWSIRTIVSDRRIRTTDTWDCGQPITSRMQYSATGFSAPVRFFYRSFVVATKTLVCTPVVSTNRWVARKSIAWDISSVWERWVYASIAAGTLYLAHGVRRLQSGVVQAYILLVFITLIAALLYAV